MVNTFIDMRKFSIVILFTIAFTQWVNATEKTVISQWLQAGPIELQYPAFHQAENVFGKTFSDALLLSHEHLVIKDYFPEQGLALPWPTGQGTTWQPVATNENGFVDFSASNTSENPQVAYLAAYIRADRWINTQLEIKSPYLLEVWLNGNIIGTKTTVENEENTIGRINPSVKLTRGNHLLVIKTLLPPGGELDWKVMANLELKEPYTFTDINHSISPRNIKNINHVLDGVKISRVEPSADGKYYLVHFSQSQPPTDLTETWSEVRRFSDNKLMHSFRHARLSRMSWLPQTNAVSYSSSRNSKSSIHWYNVETGEQKILMEDIDKLSGIKWSPDESYFIYTIREEGPSPEGNLRQVLGMRDRQPGWRNRSFLYKYDVNTGIKTRLTWGNMSTSLHDISPDSRKLLIGQSYADYTERPYSKNNLFLLDLNTMVIDTLFEAQPWGFSASFSPDGSKLLATGGPSAFNDAGRNIPEGMISNNYDTQAYIFDFATNTARCITLNFNPSVSSAYWHPLDNHIYLHVVDQDYQRVYRYDTGRDRFTLLDTGFDFVSAINFASAAHLLTFRSNQANEPHSFYVMNLKNNRVSLLKDTEEQNYRHVTFGEVNDWNFTTSSGLDIKGRYYLPPDFDPEKKYPLIVYYYGGTTPVGRTFGGRYPFNIWAGNGYVVYVLQPGGATGFGQEFSAAHVNNWGITVADEIIEGTKKFLEQHPFTDAEKVGCAGASYGGFMTMLLTTRTDIFAAAISHAGISSISSYWGEGYWGYSYSAEATAESFPWNEPDLYIGQSPLFHADKVTTPLLLITGDSDTNVPPGESIQMYTALKILDRPVELVMVKGEDHHIVTYSKRIEWHNSIMAWWDKYLKDQPQMWEDMFPERNY